MWQMWHTEHYKYLIEWKNEMEIIYYKTISSRYHND